MRTDQSEHDILINYILKLDNQHLFHSYLLLLRSHYRNYGEHKGLAVLNSELSKLSP